MTEIGNYTIKFMSINDKQKTMFFKKTGIWF